MCLADQVFRTPLAGVAMEGERISIWTSEQRQELGDEVIVANVRELRAISHVHRKSDQAKRMEWMRNKPQQKRVKLIVANDGKGGLSGCDRD
jgi:hypothetical protein